MSESTQLTEGMIAPDFELATDSRGTVKLSDLQGKNVVVYFYPKDDTPGCTKEAIAFSALLEDFAKQETVIIGISPDSVAKHAKFRTKHELSVLLGADESKAAIEAYQVWVEKKMYGRTYMGVERATYLIDKAGKIIKIWRKVKVKDHADDVLATITAHNDAGTVGQANT